MRVRECGPSLHMAAQGGPHRWTRKWISVQKLLITSLEKHLNNLHLFGFCLLKYFYFYDLIFTLIVQSFKISPRWMVLQFCGQRMLGLPVPLRERNQMGGRIGLGHKNVLSVTFNSSFIASIVLGVPSSWSTAGHGSPVLHSTTLSPLAWLSRTHLEIRN